MAIRFEFQSGCILTAEMLRSLRDYPLNFVDTYFAKYGDGIVCGMNVLPNPNGILIEKGIVKIAGKVYIISEDCNIEYHNGKNFVYVEVEEKAKGNSNEQIIRFVQKKEVEQNKMELFRYKKSEGAKVRIYDGVSDLFGEITNRIDRRNTRFSYVGGSSLSGDYFRLFAKDILQRKNALVNDIVFAYHCLNGLCDISVIEQYFESKNTQNNNIINLMKRKLNSIPTAEKQTNATAKAKIKDSKIEVW